MEKQKNKKQEGKPSSLHHYTSMETLVALLNGLNHDNCNKGEKEPLCFHASDAFQMNDKTEGVMLLNRFFTESNIKTKYKDYYAQVEKGEGEFYVISFCRSDAKSKDSGSIPMWNMYGKNGTGVILVFEYKKLEDYVSRQKNMSLCKCEYKNAQDLQCLIADKNKEIKNEEDKIGFISNLQSEAFILKDWHWEDEKEWRILVKSQNSKLKVNNSNVISYTEVHIPVNCLSAIIIGPLVEFCAIKKILDEKISELRKSDNSIDIKVKHSKLQIR